MNRCGDAGPASIASRRAASRLHLQHRVGFFASAEDDEQIQINDEAQGYFAKLRQFVDLAYPDP